MSNLTGGDFCSGLPSDEKKLLQSGGSKPPASAGSDTSHLSNARAVRQSPTPVEQMRPGWHPNLNNPKG